MIIPRNHLFKNFDGLGHFCAILIKWYVVEIQVKDIPIARVGAKTADLVIRYVLVCVCRASVRLEPSLITESLKLFFDDIKLGLKFCDPGDLLPFPPRFERQTRHQIGATQLPRMIFFWQLRTVHSHEQPLPQSFHRFVVGVSNFCLYEFSDSKRLKSCEMVLLYDLIDLFPQFLLSLCQFLLLVGR